MTPQRCLMNGLVESLREETKNSGVKFLSWKYSDIITVERDNVWSFYVTFYGEKDEGLFSLSPVFEHSGKSYLRSTTNVDDIFYDLRDPSIDPVRLVLDKIAESDNICRTKQ